MQMQVLTDLIRGQATQQPILEYVYADKSYANVENNFTKKFQETLMDSTNVYYQLETWPVF